MELIPIQVTTEGVLIPNAYLQNATEVEVQMTEHYVLIKPKIAVVNGKSAKKNGTKAEAGAKQRRFSFVASGHSKNPQASLAAETILEAEVKRQTGWSQES